MVELQFKENPPRTPKAAYRVRLVRERADLGGATLTAERFSIYLDLYVFSRLFFSLSRSRRRHSDFWEVLYLFRSRSIGRFSIYLDLDLFFPLFFCSIFLLYLDLGGAILISERFSVYLDPYVTFSLILVQSRSRRRHSDF